MLRSYVNAEGVSLDLDDDEDPDEEFECGYCGGPVTLRTGVSSYDGTVHPECRDEMEEEMEDEEDEDDE